MLIYFASVLARRTNLVVHNWNPTAGVTVARRAEFLACWAQR